MNRKIPVRNDVKRKNQIEILNFLRVHGAQPRIDIASHIKLTKAAVTTLTNEMIEEGSLVERGEIQSESQRHQRGRRKIMLDINENYRLVFGIVIERDRMQLGLTNLKGETLSRIEADVSTCDYRGVLEKIVDQINLLIKDNCISSEQLLGAGICLSACGEARVEGANVDEKLTRIRKDLSHALNFPLMTATTCVGALVAQKIFQDRTVEDMLLVRFGRKSGCAVMTNGHIYRGFSGHAGGFDRVLPQLLPGGFEGLRGQQGLVDGSHTKLNETLQEAIAVSAAVLDPERIVAFGDYMETEFAIPHINLFLDSHQISSYRVEPSIITERTVFLTGCAAAIARYFYLREF